ncbi:MAG: AEC family transporter [Oscillospiraceae bacterium]|nr:AEC family transporter [Oscillospiraceae bacterium]
MEKVFAVGRIIAPIFLAVMMGLLARKKNLLKPEEVKGLQQFAVKFGLPCVVFNACLTAQINSSALASMMLGAAPVAVAAVWAFRARQGRWQYHNLPQLFAAHETGMLGIPLTITLFGAAESYRMGVLDLAQAVVAFPVIAILTSNTGKAPGLGAIVKSVLTSPLMIMSALGLALNFSGAAAWMNEVGFGPVITEATGFLAQPVSALMLFSVGYNFSMDSRFRRDILEICGVFLGWFTVTGLIAQGILCLIPGVDSVTRWVLLLYALLPGSYLAPGLGRSEADAALASGVCSVLTVVTLLAFCVMSAIIA